MAEAGGADISTDIERNNALSDIAKFKRGHKPPVMGALWASSKHGKIDGQFVPLLHATLDCPAWQAASHGARSLYIALKRRHPRERNTAFISYRDGAEGVAASRRKIREWFAELEHYGFIVLHQPG